MIKTLWYPSIFRLRNSTAAGNASERESEQFEKVRCLPLTTDGMGGRVVNLSFCRSLARSARLRGERQDYTEILAWAPPRTARNLQVAI